MNKSVKFFGMAALMLVSGFVGWYLAKYEPPVVEDSIQYLATINDQGLDKAWFIEQMRSRGGLKPGQYQTVEQKRALLDYLINEEVIFQKAIAEGVGNDSTVSQLYKKTVIDKYLSNTLEKRLRDLSVKESEVKAHFESNQYTYNKPARRRAAIIAAEFNSKSTEEQKAYKKAQIEQALLANKELDESTHHFGDLAKTYSDDRASMYQGGVIGWFINHPGRTYKWDQAIIDTLFNLQNPGDVSEVLETGKGFYLVKLVSAENVKEKAFTQVKEGIKNQLLQEKRKQLKNNIMAELIQSATININNEMLVSISALSSPNIKDDKAPPALPKMGGAQ